MGDSPRERRLGSVLLFATVALLVGLCLPAGSGGLVGSVAGQEQQAGDGLSDERIVELILALEQEIDELLTRLPPERRAAVLRRLEAARAGRSTSAPAPPSTSRVEAEPAAETAPPPSPEAGISPSGAVAGVTGPAPEPTVGAQAAIAGLPMRRGCQTLVPFDSDGDAKITALDRFWRHLYLWTDRDGDGVPSEGEFEDPYSRGIREIAVHLRSFVKGKGKKAIQHEILIAELPIFDVSGDGWDGAVPRGDDGALAVDAEAVSKAGGPSLLSSDGTPLPGITPLRSGQRLALADGRVLEIDCP